METGSNKESMAADSRGDENVSSPGTDDDHAAVPAAGAGDEDDAAAAASVSSSPPAMGAATSSSTRPYYECVFCKRGFTTAQALGGHMNIHRRDRAKPGAARDTSSTPTGITSVSRNVECYSQYRRQAYAPSSMAVVSSGAGGSSSSSFAMYYGSAAGVDGAAAIGPRELSLFDAATTTPDQGLHLGVGRRGAGESRAPEGSEQQPGELPERELDLELRLGRHTNRYH